jgi:uncharacterized membrane protein YraQ (UPF0718 family)
VDYLSAHVLLCLVPAFLIAGAMSALVPQGAIIRYLGPTTRKYISYPMAAVAGLVLAVCSCTILPLFAGIWKRGAGLGPAVTFLFIGPAINILTITYTGSLIGWDIAGARAVLAIVFGIAIGLLMAAIFKNRDDVQAAAVSQEDEPFGLRRLSFFIVLVLLLLVGTAQVNAALKYSILAVLTLAMIAIIIFWLERSEAREWVLETWRFVKMIFPLLLAGVFLAGIAKELIPAELIQEHVGDNTIQANLYGVFFGIFMYFPTLLEVPIARMFLDLGMAKGPLLAYLLADPELSIQSVLVTGRVMGWRRNAVYVGLVAVFTTLAGWLFGIALTVV